jgi:hypothetical protein
MNATIAEFIGTAILIIFGNGVVANVVLSRTKGNSSGWIVITAGWALGVFVGVFCAQRFSGNTLKPPRMPGPSWPAFRPRPTFATWRRRSSARSSARSCWCCRFS